MMTSTGMQVFFEAPNNRICQNVAGMSLKFTIGSNSNEYYEGSFIIQSIKIEK